MWILLDPYIAHRLRDEVVYLHSLWRRGPPRPTPLIHHIATGSGQPNKRDSGADKEQKRKMMTTLTQIDDENESEEKRQKVSDLGWGCMESRVEASESGTEWPAFRVKSDEAVELTAEERAKTTARKVQLRGVEASRVFFARNNNVGGDGELDSDNESEIESESEDETEDEINESEEFKFFKELFEGDEELRMYYEKNWSDGEFCCLVCRGNGEKVTKKFRNCVAVVQHAVTISRTHKRRAHRAYGQVICNLLSWDINKLPADALPVGDQGGLKLLESEVGETVVPEEHQPAGGWDVKWRIDKKPTCTAEWGKFSSERVVESERELTEDEKEKVAAVKLQERSREAARAFFSQCEFMDTDSDDESEDEDSTCDVVSNECEEYKFLVKLFEEDEELRDYYKRSWGSGAFSCLVCWGMVEKLNKRYKDCVALVQHCVSISKTKSKTAHRAYGMIICELLNWDISKLPASELPVKDVLLPKSSDSQLNESIIEIESVEKISEQHEKLQQNIIKENNSTQTEEAKMDSSWEKLSLKPEEDSLVDQQLDGSVSVVSAYELGWAPFNPSASQNLMEEPTMAEKSKLNSMKVHQKSIDATRAFFSRDRGSDDDDSQEEEEDEEESEKDDLNTFFTSMLKEGGELMGYYQTNWENGDFSCLVCGGAGENLTKKFKNLVAVVQHSVTIRKSKRLRAHRAYGQVICEKLNWDVTRLPVVSSPVEDNQVPTLFNCQQYDAVANGENKEAGLQETSAN